MTLWTTFFIYLTLGMARANNICQTEAGTISDACLDEGNSFLQHAGSALSPRNVQPHNVLMEKEAVPQLKTWQDLYEHWKKGKDAQMWSELYEHWKKGKGASLQDKEAPQENNIWHELWEQWEKDNKFDEALEQYHIEKGQEDTSKLFEHVHKGKKMVGMMKKKRKKLHASSRLTEIEAIDCETTNQPLQVMRGPNGFDVKQLNIIDGAPYLVRVDSTPRMEYVARIPWGTYISGAFAPATGRFYVSTLNAEFLIIDNVISMRSYSSKDDAADLRSMSRLKAPDWAFTADCVAIDSDLEGNGIEEYIFSLYGPRLQIAKYDNTTKAFSKTWWIKVMPRRWDNIFGAGWGFQGKLFFAANRGSGVYEVPMDSFSLRPEDEFDDPDYMMQLNKLGDSDAVGINDGMNCLASASPWIVPFDCTKNSGPLQAFWRDAHYDLDMLDAATGNYTNVFKVTKDSTDPPFRVLNAWAINPADSIVYASMVIDEWNDDIYPTPPPFYIVRVDDTKVRFIAKVQAPAGSPSAGAFGPGGTYYVVSNPSLLTFEDLASYTAYESYDDPDLPSFSEATNPDYITIRNMTGAAQIADVVAVAADLGDGSGISTWVMAANTALQLVLMKPSTGEYWVVPINDVLEGTELEGVWERQNMGAAWSFEGEVFFSTNDGAGVFQVPISEVKFPLPGSVKLTRVGPSAKIHDNDGLNCVDRPNPWGVGAL